MSETASLTPEILPFGPDGVVLRLGLSPDERVVATVQVLRAALENAALPGVEEIAASLTSVLVRFDPARVGRTMVERAAAEVAQGVSETDGGLPE
ncbi:MAG: carboxyltransferase domain-containing protein, partial [Pseudooceanicola atlanticus]